MSKSRQVWYVPTAALAFAVAQAASAEIVYMLSPTPALSVTAGYATLNTSLAVSPNSIIAGVEATSSNTYTILVDNPISTGTSGTVAIGLGLTSAGAPDTNSVYYYYSSPSSSYVRNSLKALNPVGDLIGSTTRYISATTTSLGQDAWLYVPTNGDPISNSTNTTIVSPTILNPAGTVGASLTDANGLATYYAYQYNAAGQVYRNSTLSLINTSGQILGYSFRYNGIPYGTTYYNRQEGQDAWLYTNGGYTLLGLGVNNTSTGYSYTDSFSNVTFRNTTPIALNDNGWATGYNNRYAGGSSTDAGQDAWLFNGISTYQIGMTGAGSVFENSSGYRKSFVTAVNALDQVAGYSLIYNQGANSATFGTQAWIYYAPKNGTTGGTASSFNIPNGSTPAPGSYVQVGLTDSTSTGSPTSMGHISSTGFGSSTLTALNNAGQAVGTSTRYLTNSTSSVGTDVWYYDGKHASISITPIIASGNTNVSGVTISGAGNSNYVALNSAGYYASSGIVTLTSNGLVAGYTSRYASSTGFTSEGQDGWVYDPAVGTNGTVYVLTAPTVMSGPSDYGNINIQALSPTGVAVGYYYAASGSSSKSLFAWSEADNQLVTLTTSTTSTGSAAPLDKLFSGDAGWSNLLTTVMAADASSNFFGLGNTATLSTMANGAFEVSARLLGDADNNGHVDLTDLSIVLNNFGSTTSLWSNGNFDGASTVDLTDLSDVLNNFGSSIHPSASTPSAVAGIASVPEPTTLSVLATAILTVGVRRARRI